GSNVALLSLIASLTGWRSIGLAAENDRHPMWRRWRSNPLNTSSSIPTMVQVVYEVIQNVLVFVYPRSRLWDRIRPSFRLTHHPVTAIIKPFLDAMASGGEPPKFCKYPDADSLTQKPPTPRSLVLQKNTWQTVFLL